MPQRNINRKSFVLRNRGSLLTAMILAAFCSLTLYAVTAWIQINTDDLYKRQQTIQTSTYLSSLYELYGNWEQVIAKLETARQEKLPTPLNETTGNLQIWSADNELVWPVESSNSDSILNERQILLLDREVIGYYQISFPAEIAGSPHLVYIPLIFGLLIFVVSYLMLRKKDEAQAQLLHRLSDQLTPLAQTHPEHVTSQTRNSGKITMQMIDAEIAKISQRLYRLETIRKSMVADIAHELRTPLSVMRTQLDHSLTQQIPLDMTQAALLQDEIYRMSKLLSDLQQLALAESGHLPLYPTWFSLRNIIHELIELFAIDAEETGGIKIGLQGEGSFRIYADETRFRQILINLIGNALRYARTSVLIRVSFDASMCTIAVTDDGMGMEEEELPHVFERFYRGTMKRREASNGSSTGLGLGLPIVKQLVELHKGTITVTSKWNIGTTFRIQIPIFHDPEA
ncbi:sensor histidine kinase [Paenibacillus sp. SAFN-117]|uniref:sensor histidine kinase n=1 Tax=Paenibacillus sp. SAFN-117 TaxID=3436860 RepID=UPI003F80276F